MPPGITYMSVDLRAMCLQTGIELLLSAVPARARLPMPHRAEIVALTAGGYRLGIVAEAMARGALA